MPTSAEAMYPDGPNTDLGNKGEGKAEVKVEDHREFLRTLLSTGLKGLGFGGGAMGLVDDLIGSFDHERLTKPMARLQAYRASPDYKGNMPVGASREETQALREKR